MPKLTFEIEILNEDTRRDVQEALEDLKLNPAVTNVQEIFELPAKKQSKEMYFKGLWNKFYAEIDMLNNGEFADIAMVISEQIGKAMKFRMEQQNKNDAKLKGVIIN